jgi:hypothetical protein
MSTETVHCLDNIDPPRRSIDGVDYVWSTLDTELGLVLQATTRVRAHKVERSLFQCATVLSAIMDHRLSQGP